MTVISSNDVLVDLFTERAVDLLRLEAGTRNKVFEFLRELEGEIISQLAKLDPTGINGTNRQRARLEKLLSAVNDAIRGGYRDINTLMTREIREIIDIEFAWTGQAINTATSATFSDAMLTRAGLQNLVSNAFIQGAKSQDWWGRQAAGLDQKFADEMRKGVALGETNADLIARVRGTKDQRGVMEMSRSSAERLVRASVQAAANTGREAMYKENDDLITALQWHATLDTRTSKWCITRDGKHYTNDPEHKPKDGGPAWLEGPGKIHWGALAEGTLIKTGRGEIPIENIQIGDSVLTHTGEWSTVSARRAKYLEHGFVRIVHTESGRMLRATDEHPVRLANGTWVFVGALEVGNYLLCDPESVSEVSDVKRMINPESQDGPATVDQTQIAIQRACSLVAPDIDFKSNPEFGYREIENRCFEMILSNPSIIERDQSIAHHLLAMGDALKKKGRTRLSDFLAHRVSDQSAGHSLAHATVETCSFLGFERLRNHFRSLGRVLGGHSVGLFGILRTRFLGQTKRPMRFAGRGNNSSGVAIEASLLGFVANADLMSSGITGKSTVRQAVSTFDASKRKAVANVFVDDQGGEVGTVFRHEQIIALDVLTSNIYVYDLEVEGQASYMANGIVVSNCRSTSVPVLKSWRDLGIDEDEVPETTRASMDGQVPAKTSFEEWLRKQNVGRQNKVLGAEIAELWRKGHLSFTDLLDQSGRPLTTEALRARARKR